MTPFAPPESCTDMRECRHWKKNCHKCLIPELVGGLPDPDKLEMLADWFDADDREKGGGRGGDVQRDLRRWASRARALIEKAKLVEECEG